MKKYPLQQLLDIRERREEKATQALQRARQATEAAEIARDAARQDLEAFIEHRSLLAQQKYSEVLGQLVNRIRLDKLFEELGQIAEQQVRMEEQLLESEQTVEQRRMEQEQALQQYRTAYRDREKISEHRKQWLVNESLVAEQAMDTELEDFRTIPQPQEN